MPLLYEPTDHLVRYYGSKIGKLSPSPDLTMFLAGIFTGFFVLPIVMTFIGYKIEKMRP
jgi:hypothetical protein